MIENKISTGDISAGGHATTGNHNKVNSDNNTYIKHQTVLKTDNSNQNIIEDKHTLIQLDAHSLRDAIELCHNGFYDKETAKSGDEFDTNVISLNEKHELNDMCPDFWDECISPEFESRFNEFECFLKKRENSDLLHKLESVAKSVNRELLARRRKSEHLQFQEIIQNIAKTLLESQYEKLSNKHETVEFVLYYLYSQCLLGRKTVQEKKQC
ncbi:ABC-three component system protein [Endozoicomonas sp. ALC020]|uniref:ABC-three component system protein n=1 Tax=unclassified Endozoicomonas TaxID=2644528 RepID=UPI003BAF8E1A